MARRWFTVKLRCDDHDMTDFPFSFSDDEEGVDVGFGPPKQSVELSLVQPMVITHVVVEELTSFVKAGQPKRNGS